MDEFGFKNNNNTKENKRHLDFKVRKSLLRGKKLSSCINKRALISVLISLLIIVISYSGFLVSCNYMRGKQAVMLMYNFKNPTTLAEVQMKRLRKITTPVLYEKVTSTNVERALVVYLKFMRNPSKVNIISNRFGQVLYKLDCKSIESDRVFMFKYKVNLKGKISDVSEYELDAFQS